MKQASRFSVMAGWKLLLTDMAVRPVELLALADLPADLFVRKEASLSTAEYYRLWQALAELVGENELPLRIGQAISVEAFDPPIFASLCSPNFNVALQRLSQFKRLICPLTLAVDVGESRTTATLHHYGYDGAFPAAMAATEVVFLTKLLRLATRREINPLEVVLPEPPSDRAAYREFFGQSIRPGAVVSISFSAADAAQPFITENDTMWAAFEPNLRQRLADLDAQASTSQRVKGLLLEMLPSGESAIEAAANRLACSKRTLQRRLSDEATNYQELLKQTRQQLAEHYLANSEMSPGEISFLLGFQDSNSFYRAFNDWTGQTPDRFRSAAVALH